MSAYCLSAAPAGAAVSSSSSSSSSAIYNRSCSFNSHIQLHSSSQPKPFKLLAQNPNSLLFLPTLRHRRGRRFLAAAFEASGDEQQDPESDELAGAAVEEVEDENEEVEEKPTQASGEEGRLYVGNLPYATTSFELSQVFGEAGNVVDVQIVYDRVTDRSRGFAFVTMASNEEAKEAIRMFDGSQIGGRTVKVNFPEVPRGGEREVMRAKIRESSRNYVDSPHKIYAGNLGWGLTSQGLREAFADQPGLLGAKVIYDRNNGRSRGFGFITFESAGDVQSALDAMNGAEVEGRPLRLSYAAEKSPASRSSADERDTEKTVDDSELVSSVNM